MTRSLGAEWYTSDAVHDAERRSLWRQQWIMFATLDELREPGSYVADSVAGWPVLVVRDPQGELRAFLNICPHRAGAIAWPGSGTTGNLVCRYHGWAFSWTGELKSARDFGDSPCVEENSLTAVAVDSWGPLVFVNLSTGTPTLRESLGELDRLRHEFGLDELRHVSRVERDLSCNWKTYVDNYLEAYHVPMLHPLLGSALDVKTYRVTVPDPSYCVHTCDTVDGAVSSGRWVFRYPNLAINVYANALNIERIVPLSTTRTRIVYDYFASDSSADVMALVLEMSRVTLDEDQVMVEAVQKNLTSGAYRAGLLSPVHEIGLSWFQSRIRHDVQE
jgi:choline monooxygenase